MEISASRAKRERSGGCPRLILFGKHPLDAGTGVDPGRIVDGKDVGAHVHRKHQLGAPEHYRLDALFGELRDERLELALAVTDDAAGGELFEDDPVDFADPCV